MRIGQIRDFLAKVRYKSYFLGLIAAKVVSNDNFQDYLAALSSDFCYSNPLLCLFSFNFDAYKGHLKSPLFVIFICHFVPYFRVPYMEFSLFFKNMVCLNRNSFRIFPYSLNQDDHIRYFSGQ